MTSTKISKANNSVCDANILTEDGTYCIKVMMLSSSRKRSTFVEKCEAKSPVKTASFGIRGKIKRVESTQSVLCSPNINHSTQQHFPKAILADETGSIKILEQT